MIPPRRPFWLIFHAPVAMFLQRYGGGRQVAWPIPPPSAGYGLVCNTAGIDVNDYSAPPVLAVRDSAPCFYLATGVIAANGNGSVLTHMHICRVGAGRKGDFGTKDAIEPARRELLLDVTLALGVDAPDPAFRGQIEASLRGDTAAQGFLFAGTSDCLIDTVEVRDEPPEAVWWCRTDATHPPRQGSDRFPVFHDRHSEGKSRWTILGPSERTNVVPELAWVAVGPS